MDTYELKSPKKERMKKKDHFYRNLRIVVLSMSIAALAAIEIISWIQTGKHISLAAIVVFIPLWWIAIFNSFGGEDDDDGDI
jgi:hypothetical protein